MFNVDIQNVVFKTIIRKGCYFEHGEKIIKIRNGFGKVILEIIYRDTDNSIIVLDNKKEHYAKKVKISILYERIILFLYDKDERNSENIEVNLD